MPSPQIDATSAISLFSSKLSGISRSVIATWLAAMAFIGMLLGGWLHTKSTVEQQLRDNIATVAQLAADRVALKLDFAQQALQSVGSNMSEAGFDLARRAPPERRKALVASLDQARVQFPDFSSLVLVDGFGDVVASSPALGSRTIPGTRPFDISGSAQASPGTVSVSSAFADQAGGQRRVRLTYEIAGSDGRAGQIQAVLSLDNALRALVTGFSFQRQDFIAINDASDQILVVLSGTNEHLSEPGLTNYLGSMSGMAADSSIRYLSSAQDGAHLVATRRVPRYHFYIVFGKSIDVWLARWRQEQFLIVLAIMAALVVTGAITTGIQRRLTLTAQLQKVRGDLEETNNTLRATLSIAESLAARDQLTGLWNRRSFDQRMEGSIARTARYGGTFSLLLIDIDHFKQVNDYFGHIAGDEVLRKFGEVLQDRLRQNDVAARWGGEEFVILADGTDLEHARVLAEQIRDGIHSTSFSPIPRITVSIGVAEFLAGESGDDLLKRADKALYGAKRNGRNRVIAAESSPAPVRRSA